MSYEGEATRTTQGESQRYPYNIDPWSISDRPFFHSTRKLDTFLLFLMDAAASRYYISHMGLERVEICLVGPEGSEIAYSARRYSKPGEPRLSDFDTERFLKGILAGPSSMSHPNRRAFARALAIYFGMDISRLEG